MFAIQSEIARQVAEAIPRELGIEDAALYGGLSGGRYTPQEVRAYELLRKGIELGTFALTEEALRQGSELYRQALAIDSGYADAHAMLVMHDWLLSRLGYDPTAERRASARTAAGRDREALETAVRHLPERSRMLEEPMRRGFEQGGYARMVGAMHAQLVAWTGRPCGIDAGLGAYAYAVTGDAERMYGCLDKALGAGHSAGLYLKAHPAWAPYRDDPRFRELLRRRGLANR